MQRLTFLLFILFPLFCFSQVSIIIRSSTDSSLSIAYIGVGNTIELLGYMGSGKISFTTTNGTLTDLGQNRYVLRPYEEGECILTFKEKEKLIAQKIFKAEVIPQFIVRLGNADDSITRNGRSFLAISISKFVNDPVLRVFTPNSYLNQKFEIVNFRLTYDGIGLDEGLGEMEVTGSRLTKEQIIKISDGLSIDSYIFVDKIRCKFPDGTTRSLIPLIYIVTN